MLALTTSAAYAQRGTTTQLRLPRVTYLSIRLSDDGQRIIYLKRDLTLFVANRYGDNISLLMRSNLPDWFISQTFDIDSSGRRIVYERRYGGSGRGEIVVLDVDTREDTVIGETRLGSGLPRISGDGRTVFFHSEAYSGSESLYVVPADGGLQPVSLGSNLGGLAVNHDGTRISYYKSGDIWVASAPEGITGWPGVHRQVTSGPEQDSSTTLSGDGSTLAYRSSPSPGVLQIRVASWDGAPLSEIYSVAGNIAIGRLTDTGDALEFSAPVDDEIRLFVARTDGSHIATFGDIPGQLVATGDLDGSGTTLLYALKAHQDASWVAYLHEAALSLQGAPNPGGLVTFRLAFPDDGDVPYGLVASRSRRPGFEIPGNRRIPLALDGLARRSIASSLPGLTGFQGRLDSDGIALATLLIPDSVPPGTTVYLAAVTSTGRRPRAIRSISNPVILHVLNP